VATVLYAVAEPPYDRFSISSAGHLAPYLIPAEGTTGPLEVSPDPPLGVRGRSADLWTRHVTHVELPPGASLCLFTDGLVERRPSVADLNADQIDDGLARLAAALRPSSADTMCTTVLSELVGDDIIEDDIALLVLRRLRT
jgi:serine phosphatase RsbU (regulator of sigma subunit)